MDTLPRTKDLANAAGISKSYASEIRNGRIPQRALAIHIYRKTGWRHACLSELSDDQIAMFEQFEPWLPTAERAA